MDTFWPIWLSIWSSTIMSLTGLMYAVAQQNAVEFLEAAPIESLAARAVYIAYSIFDKIFGTRMFSARALATSTIFSTLSFLISFFLAAATTPGFWNSVVRTFNAVGPTVAFSEYGKIIAWGSVLLVVVSLLFEFLYVAKSRLILKSLRFEQSYAGLFTRLLLDIATTFAMFLAITPVSILLALNILGVVVSGVDVQHVVLAVSINLNPSTPAHFALGYLDAKEPLKAYAVIARGLAFELFSHFHERFAYFHFLLIAPVVKIAGFAEVARGVGIDLTRDRLALGFTYPETTMLATAFATTAWVGLGAFFLSVARFLCHTFLIARRALNHMHNHPHLIFWFGIFPSVLIFVVGCLVHELAMLLA